MKKNSNYSPSPFSPSLRVRHCEGRLRPVAKDARGNPVKMPKFICWIASPATRVRNDGLTGSEQLQNANVIKLTYGAKIKPDGNGFLVTFRDIENAFTWASTYEEAIFHAQEVLDLMLLDRLEKNQEIPLRSAIHSEEIPISAQVLNNG